MIVLKVVETMIKAAAIGLGVIVLGLAFMGLCYAAWEGNKKR